MRNYRDGEGNLIDGGGEIMRWRRTNEGMEVGKSGSGKGEIRRWRNPRMEEGKVRYLHRSMNSIMNTVQVHGKRRV